MHPRPASLPQWHSWKLKNFLKWAHTFISAKTKRKLCLFIEGTDPITASWPLYLICLSVAEGTAHASRKVAAGPGPDSDWNVLYGELGSGHCRVSLYDRLSTCSHSFRRRVDIWWLYAVITPEVIQRTSSWQVDLEKHQAILSAKVFVFCFKNGRFSTFCSLLQHWCLQQGL